MHRLQRISSDLVFKVVKRGLASQSAKLVNVEDTGKGYSIMKLNRKPVNSLNLELLQQINSTIMDLEADKNCRGVIVTSDLPVFSAGLDLMEMYNPDEVRIRTFWKEVQMMKLNLFRSPLVWIAAINGACPAGGCAIAFSCDHRIMADGKHTIGLNETLIGLAAPFWLVESLKLLTGHREAERMLSLSVLQQPRNALAKGVVDEVVPAEILLQRSKEEMEAWLKIPDVGRIATKNLTRRAFLKEFNERLEEDLETVVIGIQNPQVQHVLGLYLQKLKEKKK